MRYDQGDEVTLKIEDSFGYTDKTYKAVRVTIIGYSIDIEGSDLEYLCYVPPYFVIPTSFTLRAWHIKKFDMDPKFLGDQGYYITSKTQIYKHVPTTPGQKCKRCHEFTPYATLNSDGAYLCRACKKNPYR